VNGCACLKMQAKNKVQMKAIYLKELQQFFSSLIGYITIIVFLVVTGLFLWVFPDTNILDFGYASMDYFFYIAPFILLFLIPAITMRSFAEEMNTGTIELLSTKPVSDWDILLGKYFAALTLVLVALAPTLVYWYTVYNLALPIGNVDMGGTAGSYFGLIFLAAVFCAIGVFCSSITTNQIVSFVAGVFLSFFLYLAFENLSKLGVLFAKNDYLVESLGLNAHYSSMSRGVVDSRDVVYFLSVISLFLLFTRTSLASKKW
jgi:ABC-2 type transport system permease protein